MFKQKRKFEHLKAIKLGEDLSEEFRNEWRKKDFSLTVIPPDGERKVYPLGYGSDAAVYRVVHEGIKKTTKGGDGQAVYAAKVIPKKRTFGGRMRSAKEIDDVKDRAIKEANNLMELSHKSPYIINCYGALENEIAYFLITEYAHYGEFFYYFQNNKTSFSEVMMEYYIKQLCEGVRFLHREYIHFDLKSENLFLMVRNERVYLSQKVVLVIGDLGHLTKKDKSGMAKGIITTESYAAPELILYPGKQVSDKVDIWSIGVTVFNLIFNTDFISYLNVYFKMSNNTPIKDIIKRLKTNYSDYNENQDGKIFAIYEFIEKDTVFGHQLSDESKAFIKACLKITEEERASIEEILSLPWLSNIENNIREDFQVKDTWRSAKDKVVTKQRKDKFKQQYGSEQDNNSQALESNQNRTEEKRRSSTLSDKKYHQHISRIFTSTSQNKQKEKRADKQTGCRRK